MIRCYSKDVGYKIMNTQKTPNKTGRKNKTKLVVNWPASHFTIKELHALNPDFVEITLRVRLQGFLERSEVTELGTLHMEKGRPKLVFAKSPVNAKVIESAKNSGVLFSESTTVKVTDITSPTQPAVTLKSEPAKKSVGQPA